MDYTGLSFQVNYYIVCPRNRKRSPKGRSPDIVAEGNWYGVVLRGINYSAAQQLPAFVKNN
jgi:hypothetical protein